MAAMCSAIRLTVGAPGLWVRLRGVERFLFRGIQSPRSNVRAEHSFARRDPLDLGDAVVSPQPTVEARQSSE